jgi:alpha-tubulin suppressor-like RCC1 family protein
LTFTVTPSLKMFYSTTYKIRVTDAAKDSAGNTIDNHTQTYGFKTTITVPMTAGFAHSCFMLDNGSVKCWGENNLGQLGLGDTINRRDNSSYMGDNLTIVDLGSGRTATAIATGDSHTCVILDNVSIKCWGSNASGQLGLGDNSTRGDGSASGGMGDNLTIVDLGSGRTAKAIAAGNQHTCAILDNSSVKCWGANASGQLGLGDDDNRGDGSASGGMGDNLTIVDLGSGRTAKVIAAGDSHTCAILDNASVKCWGENGNGQLGLGPSISNRGDGSGEMGDNLTAINLGSGRTATSITTGTGYTCVLLDDDSVKCWGRADYGQLGAGKTEEYNEPNASPIDLGTGITAIASGYFHTCAILDNSSIKCWGRNDSGQLGIGDTGNRGDGTNSSGLTEMGGSLPVVDLGPGRTARGITAGDSHTCALLDNFSVKCWGKNESGQLGLGDNSTHGDGSGEMGDNLPVISL